MEDLGGPAVHSANGVCQLVAVGEHEAIELTRELLGLLLSTPTAARRDRAPAEAAAPDPGTLVPAEPRRIYDVREVARAIVDRGRLLELSAALGTQHGHRARPASTAAPSGSSPTSRAASAA